MHGVSAFTDDRLLDGRVMLRQPATGFRAAVDPVLLAAFVPAKPGQRVLEAGCGSGAAFLCLAIRVAELSIVAIERDEATAELARDNAARNGLGDRATVIAGDVADPGLVSRLGRFDHAFANPPFWPGGTPPPSARRAAATHESAADLRAWVRFLGSGLIRGGTISLVLPSARFADGVAALKAAQCGGVLLLPLAPHEGEPARRVLLRGIVQSKSPDQVLPALALHARGQGYTADAERILRAGEALPVTPAV